MGIPDPKFRQFSKILQFCACVCTYLGAHHKSWKYYPWAFKRWVYRFPTPRSCEIILDQSWVPFSPKVTHIWYIYIAHIYMFFLQKFLRVPSGCTPTPKVFRPSKSNDPKSHPQSILWRNSKNSQRYDDLNIGVGDFLSLVPRTPHFRSEVWVSGHQTEKITHNNI